jgi:hypothetical protein
MDGMYIAPPPVSPTGVQRALFSARSFPDPGWPEVRGPVKESVVKTIAVTQKATMPGLLG